MAKLNSITLQKLSSLRRKEAAALIKHKHFPAAYYLLGYSVECALKACIAKQTERFDFPDKKLAHKAHTHELEVLLGLAGLKNDFQVERGSNRTLDLNWTIVKDWNSESRYELGITSSQARDFYSACTSRKHGVLTWIRARW